MLSNVFTLGLMALSARCAIAAALPKDDLTPVRRSEAEPSPTLLTPLTPAQYTIMFASEGNYQGTQDWHANLWTENQCFNIGNGVADNVGSIFIGSANTQVYCTVFRHADCVYLGEVPEVIQASNPDPKWANLDPKGNFQSFVCDVFPQ
ncbi:hypothetical protein BGZ63DRAFT_425495 [Mariannaea sp. PMI_226]|nr:hypothetical protein BGZ63DRAFT_425495 [Mariannaea sp. PMI_226]